MSDPLTKLDELIDERNRLRERVAKLEVAARAIFHPSMHPGWRILTPAAAQAFHELQEALDS